MCTLVDKCLFNTWNGYIHLENFDVRALSKSYFYELRQGRFIKPTPAMLRKRRSMLRLSYSPRHGVTSATNGLHGSVHVLKGIPRVAVPLTAALEFFSGVNNVDGQARRLKTSLM